jgi:hypothetical protein
MRDADHLAALTLAAFVHCRRRPVALIVKLAPRLTELKHLCADRHAADHGLGVAPCAILPATVPTVFGHEARVKIEVRQVADVLVGDQHDVSTPAAVAAIGTTAIHVLLAAERNAPVAAVAGMRLDFDLVDKHAGRIAGGRQLGKPRRVVKNTRLDAN